MIRNDDHGYTVFAHDKAIKIETTDATKMAFPTQSILFNEVVHFEQDQEDQGGASNRQIDVENPAPRNVLNDQATKHRSQCSPKGDQAKDQSQVVPSLSQGHQITHDNFDQDVNTTSTDALDRSSSNQHVNVTGPAADAAAQSKDGRGDNDRIASSENIGQLSIKRLKGSPVAIH
ncbi:MAG: hypothetical protein Q9187_000534, partial [Circinaria calcarea]